MEQQLEADLAGIEKQLAAVRLTKLVFLRKMAGTPPSSNLQPVEVTLPTTTTTGGNQSYGDVAETVRMLVAGSNSNFTIPQIEQQLTNKGVKFKPGTVRGVIYRMIERNLAKIAVKGSGRTPTLFAKM